MTAAAESAEDPPMTLEKALHRAVFWLSALIAEAEIDPDDTTITVTAKKGGEVALVQEINLGADLRTFADLGAPTQLFSEEA